MGRPHALSIFCELCGHVDYLPLQGARITVVRLLKVAEAGRAMSVQTTEIPRSETTVLYEVQLAVIKRNSSGESQRFVMIHVYIRAFPSRKQKKERICQYSSTCIYT